MTVRQIPAGLMAIVATLMLAAGPVQAAGECDADLKVVDESLAKKELAEDERAQLEDMRAQAQALCDSGNTDEGLALLAEAKGILGIE